MEDLGMPAALKAALLLIVGEPLSEEHKDLIPKEITKGFRAWDTECTGVDINEELAQIANKADLGEEGPYGERILGHRSDELTVDVLVSPQTQTLSRKLKNFLSTPTKYRHIIYAGHAFEGTGAWVLQDDTFSFGNFAAAFKDPDVENALKQLEEGCLNIYCFATGEWNNANISKVASKMLQINLNPEEKLSNFNGILQFTAYLCNFIKTRSLKEILKSSDVVGNIRFSKPTLYVFPGCQGDSALFGINGFNLLVNGGYNKKACFWDFTRHLDRIDAVLLTHLGTDNLFGIGSVLNRKSIENVHPEIGFMYLNAIKSKHSLNGEEKDPSLLINLAAEGERLVDFASQLGQLPHPCSRTAAAAQALPINLYHKVGHGSLDMYILNPVQDSKELKEFFQQWNKQQIHFSSSQQVPLPNMLSICALLIWRPANSNESITRIFFPGNAPQHKVIEGLEKIKTLDVLKQPRCCDKDLNVTKPAVKKNVLAKAKPQLKPTQPPKVENSKRSEMRKDRPKASSPKSSKVTKEDINKKASKSKEKTESAKLVAIPPKSNVQVETPIPLSVSPGPPSGSLSPPSDLTSKESVHNLEVEKETSEFVLEEKLDDALIDLASGAPEPPMETPSDSLLDYKGDLSYSEKAESEQLQIAAQNLIHHQLNSPEPLPDPTQFESDPLGEPEDDQQPIQKIDHKKLEEYRIYDECSEDMTLTNQESDAVEADKCECPQNYDQQFEDDEIHPESLPEPDLIMESSYDTESKNMHESLACHSSREEFTQSQITGESKISLTENKEPKVFAEKTKEQSGQKISQEAFEPPVFQEVKAKETVYIPNEDNATADETVDVDQQVSNCVPDAAQQQETGSQSVITSRLLSGEIDEKSKLIQEGKDQDLMKPECLYSAQFSPEQTVSDNAFDESLQKDQILSPHSSAFEKHSAYFEETESEFLSHSQNIQPKVADSENNQNIPAGNVSPFNDKEPSHMHPPVYPLVIGAAAAEEQSRAYDKQTMEDIGIYDDDDDDDSEEVASQPEVDEKLAASFYSDQMERLGALDRHTPLQENDQQDLPEHDQRIPLEYNDECQQQKTLDEEKYGQLQPGTPEQEEEGEQDDVYSDKCTHEQRGTPEQEEEEQDDVYSDKRTHEQRGTPEQEEEEQDDVYSDKRTHEQRGTPELEDGEEEDYGDKRRHEQRGTPELEEGEEQDYDDKRRLEQRGTPELEEGEEQDYGDKRRLEQRGTPELEEGEDGDKRRLEQRGTPELEEEEEEDDDYGDKRRLEQRGTPELKDDDDKRRLEQRGTPELKEDDDDDNKRRLEQRGTPELGEEQDGDDDYGDKRRLEQRGTPELGEEENGDKRRLEQRGTPEQEEEEFYDEHGVSEEEEVEQEEYNEHRQEHHRMPQPVEEQDDEMHRYEELGVHGHEVPQEKVEQDSDDKHRYEELGMHGHEVPQEKVEQDSDDKHRHEELGIYGQELYEVPQEEKVEQEDSGNKHGQGCGEQQDGAYGQQETEVDYYKQQQYKMPEEEDDDVQCHGVSNEDLKHNFGMSESCNQQQPPYATDFPETPKHLQSSFDDIKHQDKGECHEIETEHQVSSIPEAFEKDETPTPAELLSASAPVNVSNIDFPQTLQVRNTDETDSIDGGTPDDDKDVDEAFGASQNKSLVNPWNQAANNLQALDSSDTKPFDPFSESYNPFVGIDYSAAQGEQKPFNPISDWGEPMGLPSPPPPNNAKANGNVAAEKASRSKAKPKNDKSPEKRTETRKSDTRKPLSTPGKNTKIAEKRSVMNNRNGKTANGDNDAKTKPKTTASFADKSKQLLTDKKQTAKARPSSAPVKTEIKNANITKKTDIKSKTAKRPGTATNSRASPASKTAPPLPPLTPFYVDLTYIPNHGNAQYSDAEFFKRVRARYYVLSALSPNPQILNALLEAKQTWEDKNLEVTVIPTYDNETLRHWMGLHKDQLSVLKIDVAPSASRCTIQLQDHETSCSAYRLEF